MNAASQQSKPREKRRLNIIDPNTGRSIFDSKEKQGEAPQGGAATPTTEPPSTPTAEVPPAVEASEPPPVRKPVSGVAAQFAAQVAAVADTTNKDKVESKPEEAAVVPKPEPTPPPPQAQEKETLSVVTESKRGGEDYLYEPVSPTPLPDSPVDEVKKESVAVAAAAPAVPEAPAAAVSPVPEAGAEDDAGFVEAKSSRKKKSVATKKAELNRKGNEKGKDVLDLFKDGDRVNIPVPKQPTPPKEEPAVAPQPLLKEVKEPSPPVVEAPKPEPLMEVDVQSALLEAAPGPAEQPSKESTPASEASVEVKENGVEGENHVAAEGELEEGEIADDEDSRVSKLKYEYKDGQWSPLNQDGKRQYDREFLIKLQFDDLSLSKPPHLPNMEIVKDKPTMRREGQGRLDFVPSFVKSTPSGRQGGGIHKRASKSKDMPKPARVIQISSFSQEVSLHKAENAWTPGTLSKRKGGAAAAAVDDPAAVIDDLAKKVRAILNKLTPSKFETLVERFKELPIETETSLRKAMELIFEKAVDEPAFSVAYAQMCKYLQTKKVPMESKPTEPLEFRKVLISRVQQEFQKNYMDDVDEEGFKAKMADPNLTEEQKKREKELYEHTEMKARRRSLGNIRFIGELYKLEMLSVRIMHECVVKLLASSTDEEGLECLCRLLTTVGKEFEAETNKKLQTLPKEKLGTVRNITIYFADMKKIISGRKTSARVRFLMQDVIDLKENKWQKRREDAGPKTIEEIHADIKKEQLREKLNAYNQPSGPPARRDDRRDDRRGGGGDDPRKRSQRGDRGGDRSGGGGGQSEDGWQVPTRPAKNTLDKVDTSRIKNISSNKVDMENIQLGPPRAGGAMGTWGKGSSGSRSSRQEDTSTTNRFAAFSSSETSREGYEGRISGGYSGRRSSSRSRESYEGRISGGFGGRSGGSGSRPGAYGGRGSRGQSAENDKARAAAVQAVKGMTGGRSASSMLPRDSSSGRVPPSGTRSYSMMGPPAAVEPKPELPLNGRADESADNLAKMTEALLDEFLNVCDYNEAYQCISEKFHSDTMHIFVENVYNYALEKSEKARRTSGQFMSNLVRKKMLRPASYLKGMVAILEFAEDLIVDIPKFWDNIADLLVPALLDEMLPMTFIRDSEKRTETMNPKLRQQYLAGVLRSMGVANASKAAQLWSASGLAWSDFLPADQDVKEFMRSNKLEFLEAAGGNTAAAAPPAADAFRSDLTAKLRSDRSNAVEFIHSKVDKKLHSNTDFIKTLVEVTTELSLEGLGGPAGEIKLKEDLFKSYCSEILQNFFKQDSLQLEALFVLQSLMHRLEHPRGILGQMFNVLYECDVISAEAFTDWKQDDRAAYQADDLELRIWPGSEGKGVAVKSCIQFLTWLEEAEEGEEELARLNDNE